MSWLICDELAKEISSPGKSVFNRFFNLKVINYLLKLINLLFGLTGFWGFGVLGFWVTVN